MTTIMLVLLLFGSVETKRALMDLNSVCADTWCEGDYSIDFTDIRCKEKQCIVYASARHWSNKTGPARKIECPVPRWQYADYQEYLSLSSEFYYYSLAEPFYLTVDTCVGKLESKRP